MWRRRKGAGQLAERLLEASEAQSRALRLYLESSEDPPTLGGVARIVGRTRERVRQLLGHARSAARRCPDLVARLDGVIEPLRLASRRPLTLAALEAAEPWFAGVGADPQRFARLLFVLGSRHAVMASRAAPVPTVTLREHAGLTELGVKVRRRLKGRGGGRKGTAALAAVLAELGVPELLPTVRAWLRARRAQRAATVDLVAATAAATSILEDHGAPMGELPLRKALAAAGFPISPSALFLPLVRLTRRPFGLVERDAGLTEREAVRFRERSLGYLTAHPQAPEPEMLAKLFALACPGRLRPAPATLASLLASSARGRALVRRLPKPRLRERGWWRRSSLVKGVDRRRRRSASPSPARLRHVLEQPTGGAARPSWRTD